MTTGNSQDFGDATTVVYREGSGASNSTRGLVMGGNDDNSVNTIEFVTIATLGNAQDFGDLNAPTSDGAATSNSTRAVLAGGAAPVDSTNVNVIHFVTILTTGDSLDFGDITSARGSAGGCSNGHGGL